MDVDHRFDPPAIAEPPSPPPYTPSSFPSIAYIAPHDTNRTAPPTAIHVTQDLWSVVTHDPRGRASTVDVAVVSMYFDQALYIDDDDAGEAAEEGVEVGDQMTRPPPVRLLGARSGVPMPTVSCLGDEQFPSREHLHVVALPLRPPLGGQTRSHKLSKQTPGRTGAATAAAAAARTSGWAETIRPFLKTHEPRQANLFRVALFVGGDERSGRGGGRRRWPIAYCWTDCSRPTAGVACTCPPSSPV